MDTFLNSNDPDVQTINEMLIDFGFYHTPTQVKRMYAEKTNHGLLGYAGGVIDQPDEYWFDMGTMYWLHKWVEVVKDMPRIEQVSIFETHLRKQTHGND